MATSPSQAAESFRDKKIGEVLVMMGHLSRDQVSLGLTGARKANERLGRYLIRSQLITPETLCHALALQSGLAVVDLAGIDLPAELSGLFPYTVMKEHCCVPFETTSNTVCVAVTQPLKGRVIRELEQGCGRTIQMYIGREDLITVQLDQIYRGRIPRKFTRYPARLPVHYQFCTRLGAPLQESYCGATTLNLSQGGVAIESAVELPDELEQMPRHELYAGLTLAQEDLAASALCQLRWLRQRDDAGVRQMGFEIVEISSPEQQKWQDICIKVAQGKVGGALAATRRPNTNIIVPSFAPSTPAASDSSPGAEAVDTTATETLPVAPDVELLTPDKIHRQLRALGIVEDVLIHQQNYGKFLQEQGIRQLGRGGEGAVYFLRGHVVKVAAQETAKAALREIAHMLHLNPLPRGAAMGERQRHDVPAPIWTYVLSNGSLAIGMRPFDPTESAGGATLHARLRFGPRLGRAHSLGVLRGLAHTLSYLHSRGLIHHDLKPANIFVPADPQQMPVVFDLSQSLWKRDTWGRDWLKHEHNQSYWYNGTYRYMHHRRRLAHLGALATLARRTVTKARTEALQQHQPSFYDDVFAFARILRDYTRSRHMDLTELDRREFVIFYRELMGLDKVQPVRSNPKASVTRLAAVFGVGAKAAVPPRLGPDKKWPSMERVTPAFEKLLDRLIKPRR